MFPFCWSIPQPTTVPSIPSNSTTMEGKHTGLTSRLKETSLSIFTKAMSLSYERRTKSERTKSS